MIITKKCLPRRTFLRGVGATLALPLLDSMVPALSATARTAANPVRRLGFIYFPHGSVSWAPEGHNTWTPPGAGGPLELSPILQRLEPVKSRTLVLSNMEHRNAQGNGTDGNAEHTRSNASWLSAARPKMTEGADVRLATTVDQIAAQKLCRDTRLPSLELTLENSFLVGNCDNGYNCVYVNTLSWSSPTTPLPMENNPRMVFERLFGDGGTVDERRAEMRRDRSILDSVTEDMARLVNSLGASDRVRVDQYVDAVREVERRIQRAEAQAGESTLTLPDRPVGIPETYDEHARLLLDLLLLTYQADITRVFSLQLGREQSARTFPWIGVNEGHHAVSHHQDDPRKIASIAAINTYHVELLSYFRREAGRDAGRGRQPAGPLDGAARQRHEQREPPQPQEPAARAGRRRGRTAEGRPAHQFRRAHADGEPAAGPAGQGRSAGRELRRQQRACGPGARARCR